jgi:hypothetical protein
MTKVYLAFLLVLLTGCATSAPKVEVKEVVKIVDNPEKDKFIERVEHEASEAAAALIVVQPAVKGPQAKLVELTKDRMAGLRKPSAEQVQKYEKALMDEVSMKTEQDKARKVDEETTKLYERVEKVDLENKDIKEKVRLMEEQRQSEIRAEAYEDLRDTCLLLCTILVVAGVGIALIGHWMGKGIKAGVLVTMAGIAVGASPLVIQDVVEAPWFKWTIGGIVLAGMAYGIYELFDTDKQVRRKKANVLPDVVGSREQE